MGGLRQLGRRLCHDLDSPLLREQRCRRVGLIALPFQSGYQDARAVHCLDGRLVQQRDHWRAPRVVADAILFACAHPRRTLYAGGGGLIASLLSQAAPRWTDAIMEVAGAGLQQKPDDPGDPARRDNLYHPRDDALRGSQDVRARQSSLALQIQKLPLSLLALGVVGAGAVGLFAFRANRRG